MGLPVSVLKLGYRGVLRPRLFAIGGGDPERAHEWSIAALSRLASLPPALAAVRALCGRPNRPTVVAGIEFPGRVGVAAGLEKNAVAVPAWSALGFGFAELGTVTAAGQPGNPKPRMFRLRDSGGIVNRMGFNNDGAAVVAQRLERIGASRGHNLRRLGMPLGISIGKSRVTPVGAAVGDYVTSLRLLAPYADYIAVNVSSPNTPDLRRLQERAALVELTAALRREARDLAGGGAPMPIFVKLAPDLAAAQLDDILTVCEDGGVAGLIVSNTTIGRDGLAPRDRRAATEAGGLSGRPLTSTSLALVSDIAHRSTLPVMGAGGIMRPVDARAMFDAGARLVQLYTGFIYEGPALVAAINRADARR